MAKVLLSLSDEQIRDTVVAALAETKHAAVVMEALDPAEGLMPVADKIMAHFKSRNF